MIIVLIYVEKFTKYLQHRNQSFSLSIPLYVLCDICIS
ncbi:uncharacterized protein METZ01_LOCUS467277 [marine metagenome]|uniref:Uncharacterized protein n=1 Tax=marine metagenome TaxID=408172 RepID=A0A383B3N2_9ZZZZ